MFAWNSREIIKNNCIVFLGIAYLFIGGLDMLHMLSYTGMGIFKEGGGNLPTQLWIIARYMESVTLLITPFFLTRKIRVNQVISAYLLITILFLSLIFYWRVFPDCFVDGIGLTSFKKNSEYIISMILIGSLYFLFQRRHEFERSVFVLLSTSIILTIISELAFTFYISAYGFSNMVGHIFKIVSYYLIYKAIIDTGLKRPYNLMFKEISEKENRYRQMFDTNMAIKLIINPEDGAIVEANTAACNFYGYSKDKFTGLKITDLNTLPPEKVIQKMEKAKGKKELSFNFSHRLASGETKEVEVYSGPISFGEQTFLYSIIHDVTNRKKAEEERDRMFFAIEQAGELIAITDVEGTLQYTNPSFERISGYSKDEAIGKTPRFLKSGLHDNSIYKNLWDTILSGSRWTGHLINKHKDGHFFTSECAISPVKDENETILNFIWIAKDITREVELEKKLQQSQKLESIGTLAGGIAHDFNNILTSIIGFGQIALGEVEKKSDLEDDIQEILSAGLRAKELVKQILTFARKAEVEVQPVKISQIAKEVLNFIRSSIPTTIDIQSDIKSNAMVMADPSQIHQVFMNLCTNASQAMEMDGGVLKINIADIHLKKKIVWWHKEIAAGDYIKIIVSDTGCGISKNQINNIFEPYFTTKPTGEGTGLGLSVVHGIIRNVGGEIIVDSQISKGTVFTIYLPITVKKKVIKNDETFNLPSGTERILFVDDEISITKMMGRMLEQSGYKVTINNKSIEALEIFRSNPDQFDLVITDMTMPNMTGDKLAVELINIRPDIPIIICTGYSKLITKESASQIGIMAFIDKPINNKDFIIKVRAVLDESNKPV